MVVGSDTQILANICLKKPNIYILLICLLISSCRIDDGPEIIMIECDAFDFTIAESEWIIFPEGPDYSFEGQGNNIQLTSEYQISEPFTIEFENPGLRALIPIGLPRNTECFSSYRSFHESNDGNTSFFNDILNNNNGELIFSSFAIDDLLFDLEINNDSISGTRFNRSDEQLEPSAFQTFDSLPLEGRIFENVLRITNPDLEPRQIYISKNLGLVAFQRNDTLWLRN